MKKLLIAALAALSLNLYAADCKDLMAGQHINVGTVCYDVVGSDLKVTYTTTGNWFINETHLWVGTSLANMPQNGAGNPQIGRFPYKASNLSVQTYTFTIPTYMLGLTSCPYAFYAAAHAVVQQKYGSTVVQTETAWGKGERMVSRGSWAMYSNVYIDCPGGGGAGGSITCETAYALGDKTLNSFLSTQRWGWQITFDGAFGTYAIYAGAGQNNINNGTLVGYLTVVRVGDYVNVSYDMLNGYGLNETHLYVGSSYVTTVANGLYPYTDDSLNFASSHGYTAYAGQGTVYIVAHAVACGVGL
jgi:hypothetical protein